jgi:flagella basal body P-ring formation protein FlgA
MLVRKITLTTLAVLGALAGMIALSQAASAVTLKQHSVVDSDTITLGDVFTGLSENNDKVLGLAPQPGQEMTLNAKTLLRIALALDLPWRPASTTDHVTLSRAASVVDRTMIESGLRTEIDKQGVDGHYKIVLPEATSKIVMSPDIAPNVEIKDFSMKPETGTFEAVAYAPSAANPVQKMKLTGQIQKMISVPVLREPMRPGVIIGARDLDFIDVKESDLRHDMITDTKDLIGMTPRRMASSGKPLNTLDVEAPQIIARGDLVTMLFQQAGMTLTASGKALENGAKGDTIRVVNTSSDKTIEGIVTAEKEVTITSF